MTASGGPQMTPNPRVLEAGWGLGSSRASTTSGSRLMPPQPAWHRRAGTLTGGFAGALRFRQRVAIGLRRGTGIFAGARARG
jgi:hypothetical protein